MTTRELIHEKRDEILALTAKHKAKHVRLFGSVVRGDDTPESDVDFLVDFAEGASLWDHMGLMDALSALLGREVDVVSQRALHWFIKDRAEEEAAVLMKDERLYVVHVWESLHRIMQYTSDGRDAFMASPWRKMQLCGTSRPSARRPSVFGPRHAN